MSITHRVSEFDEIGSTFGLSAGGQRCFACDELLVDPAVMWKGSNGQTIYLHGVCVLQLCVGLLRDAIELHDTMRPLYEIALTVLPTLHSDLFDAMLKHPRKVRT